MKSEAPPRSKLDEVASRDPQAQAQALAAFDAHADAVARFARRMGIRAADLDDLVQDVFLAAQDAGGFRPGAASERSWYLRLTWYAVIRQRRREDRSGGPTAIEHASVDADQHRTMEAKEQFARVSAALDALSENHRAVVVLFDIEGYAAEEIAASLGVPLGTVHSRLHHARRRLAAILRPARQSGSAVTPQGAAS